MRIQSLRTSLRRRHQARFCVVASETRQGERVEGNLQIEVRHCGSGRTWRTFHYQRGVGQHVFHGLPPANYVVRIDAAGFRVLSVDTELIAGTNDLHISLDTADADRLILDADASRKPLAAEAEHLIRDPAARAAVITDGTGRFNLTTRLTVALLEDSRVVAALAPVPRGGTMVRMAERIRTQIQNTWIFRMTGQGLESVLMNLVEARLQLFALVCAVFKNPLCSELASNISDDEVALHASRFLETLDSPELDGIYPILVELFEPRKACIEKFLRTVQADFECVRGAALLSHRTSGD